MSKERELLGVALEFLNPKSWVDPEDIYALTILSSEIEELLAQPEQEPLSDKAISKFADAEYMVCNNAFTQGVRWAETQHKIGVGDE